MITPDPRPECAQRWCREPVAGGAAYCRHHATGGAPTLPTRAERDRLRELTSGIAHLPSLPNRARDLRRLLDWADAQEAGGAPSLTALRSAYAKVREIAGSHGVDGRLPVEGLNEACAECADAVGDYLRSLPADGGEGPARRAMRQLLAALPRPKRSCDPKTCGAFECRARREAEAVLAGGQAPERGPWAVRYDRQLTPYMSTSDWYCEDEAGCFYPSPVKSWRKLFTRLGPATEEGTARWAQRMHGGVVVRVVVKVRQPDDGEGSPK